MKIAVGRKYGKWTIIDSVVRRTASGHSKAVYLVRCACGTEKWTSQGSWGKSSQCADCMKSERTARSAKKSNHPLRGIWTGILSRCRNPNNFVYHRYGGRGIFVCDRWTIGVTGACSDGQQGFDNFVADMGDRPHGHSVDRVDNDGPYSPENCRWATAKEQCNNTCRNVVYGGWSMAMWCEELGMTEGQMHRGLRVLGSLELVVNVVKSLPVEKRHHIQWVPREQYKYKPREIVMPSAEAIEQCRATDEEFGRAISDFVPTFPDLC